MKAVQLRRGAAFLAVSALVTSIMATAPSLASPSQLFGCDSTSPEQRETVMTITNRDAQHTVDLDAFSSDERTFLLLNARQEGITLEEAAERYGWHEPFSRMVDRVREGFPHEFSGAAIEPTGKVRGWVGFRSTAPAAAIEVVESFPYPVAIIEHKGFSEIEIDQGTVDAHYVVWEQQDLVSQVSSGFDWETGQVIIEVTPSTGVDINDLQRQLATVVPDAASSVPVTICIVEEVNASMHNVIRGGDRLDTAIDHCTAGFSVEGAIYRGIVTAGHCGRQHLLPLGHDGETLSHNSSHEGQWGDIGWHNSWTKNHVNQVSSTGFTVTIRGVGTPERGQRLCKHGESTGYSCDDVSRWLNECIDSTCRLVLMERNLSTHGDSGGPLWSGSTAYGMISGAKTKEFCGGTVCWRNAFSQARYIPNALGGVTVATS